MIEIELEGFITIYGKLIEIKKLEDQLRLSIYYHSKARMAKRGN